MELICTTLSILLLMYMIAYSLRYGQYKKLTVKPKDNASIIDIRINKLISINMALIIAETEAFLGYYQDMTLEYYYELIWTICIIKPLIAIFHLYWLRKSVEIYKQYNKDENESTGTKYDLTICSIIFAVFVLSSLEIAYKSLSGTLIQ